MFGEPQAASSAAGSESVRAPVPATGPEVGLAPPGVEYWAALFQAQSTVKPVAHDADVSKKGANNAKGDKLFTYTSAEAIQKEALRVLHANKLLVVQLATMGTTDRNGRRHVLHSAFMVVHSPTGQGLVYPFEAPIGVSEKYPLRQATSAACTSSTGYFLKGLLQIATPEEKPPEEQGPQWPQAQQQQAGWGPQQSQYGQPLQQQTQPVQDQWSQQPQAQYDPQAEQAAAWAAHNAEQARVAQAQQAQQTQQAPQQTQQYPGWVWDHQTGQWVSDRQPQQPIGEHPTVKAAAAILEAQPIAGQQGKPVEEAREIFEIAEETEPSGPDAWVAALTAAGIERHLAEEFAAYPTTHALNDGMRGLLWKQIEKSFGSPDNPENAARARQNWEGTGFVPRPDLPEEQRPRPTGVHALRYLLNANTNTNASTRRTTT
jgi:hypothetical protein